MTTSWKPALPGPLAEQRARQLVANAPSQNFQLLFGGAELVLNFDRRKEYTALIKQDVREIAKIGVDLAKDEATKRFGDPKEMLLDFLRQTIPGAEDLERMVDELLPDFVAELHGAIPYFGPCLQLVRGTTNIAQAVRGTVHRYEIKEARPHITPGAPLAAVTAMQELVEREIARELLVGSRQIAAGSSQLAITGANLGVDWASAVIGAGNALLSIAHNVYLHRRDNREMAAANALLGAPSGVTVDVFNTSPILGCFLVGQLPTSDLLNMIAQQIGTSPDWQSKVEQIVKQHVHPLQFRAAKLIQGSRFYLRSPNEGLFESRINKAALLPVDGSGPMAHVNLAMNKKYNFDRQVNQAKHTVSTGVRNAGKRMLQKAGILKAPVQLP